MADRFDDAKRSLEGVPAPDLWAEAQRRAAGGAGVVPLAPVAARGRRTARWLPAAAAAVVMVAGLVAVVATDDDSGLDTEPGSDVPAGDPEDDLTVYQADGACKVGIRGEPLPGAATVLVTDRSGSATTRVEGPLDATQSYALQVPGEMVIDLVGERTEEIHVQGETAVLWFQADSVQVRLFRDGTEPCESFTVTVGGGTEEEDRQAALEIAQRVVLGSDLPQGSPPSAEDNLLAGTEWFLERTIVGGEVTESGEGVLFTFTETEARWSDGCNHLSAPYRFFREWLRLGDIATTDVDCEASPTSEAVHEVMRSGEVAVTLDADRLELRAREGQLILGQAGRSVDVPTTTTAPGEPIAAQLAGLWEITYLRDLAEVVPLPQGELLVEFSTSFSLSGMSWNDGCNGHHGNIAYGANSFTVTDIEGTKTACRSESVAGSDHINAVFQGRPVSVSFDGDIAVLKAGDRTVALQRP